MDLSTDDLKKTLNEIRRLAGSVKYDLDDYNCTNLALDIFNVTRTDKLEIPLYKIPSGTSSGTKTPNGLYYRLHEMKASGHSEANNIGAYIYKGWAGGSSGPCN